ncbi:hypothetical protein [Winogradskyella alexanderae]|uniref:LTXXQ motif family protein n=1 Tax=Winogradskyella alexanderae TaxID=2877123 RepID=A0ABS7XP84_9FLAO|nr:hypothetical protein [Winogradskyella alexanderae]MCA0131806.1 hypothetical protein [Winogradskyella alexanderae]
MKTLIYIVLFFQFALINAQRPGNMRRANFGQDQNTGMREIPKFESLKLAGIFEYDTKKALKKLKLKKSDTVSLSVISKIENYNQKINQINSDNKDLFEGLDIVVNQNMETARASQNRELIRETMTMVRDKLSPVIEQVRGHEQNLNNQIKKLLSEEQNERWIKYQKAEKEKIMPRRRGSNDARNRPDNYNQNRQRRG